jgi:hypothetical protein
MPFWHTFRPGRATKDTKRCSLTDARIAQTKRIVFREETTKHIFTYTEMPFSADTGHMHRTRDRGPTIALRKQQRRNLKPDVLLVVGLFGVYFSSFAQLSVTGSRGRPTMCLAHREQGKICRPRRGRVGQMILASE